MVKRHTGEDDAADETRLYRAPALEKGLDVLELLATAKEPLSVSAIVQRLGRSTGELFRMIQVLQHRGFLAQGADGYSLTPKLFEMGLERPTIRNLVEVAIPEMRRLSGDIAQSCHLVLPSRANMVVIARMESREAIGFTVRVGYRQPLHLTSSGMLLYAFQPPEIRAEWEKLFDPAPTSRALTAMRTEADAVRARGHIQRPSGFVAGITDLSAPLLRGDRAAAALSVPFVESIGSRMTVAEVVDRLRAAAAAISQELIESDGRI